MLSACSTTIMGNNKENFTCLCPTLKICKHNYMCGYSTQQRLVIEHMCTHNIKLISCVLQAQSS